MASLIVQLVKNPPAVQESPVQFLDGKIPWRRERLPIRYSGLENSLDYIVHGVTKSQTRLSNYHFNSLLSCVTKSVCCTLETNTTL